MKKKRIVCFIEEHLQAAKESYEIIKKNTNRLKTTLTTYYLNDIETNTKRIIKANNDMFIRFKVCGDLFTALVGRVDCPITFSSFVMWAKEKADYVVFEELEFARFKYYVKTGKVERIKK